MRLWSLHPRYLDAQGLVALWREALLAQKVLQGATHGYRHHPQLQRFRASADPLAAIASYLAAVQAEAARRGYRFDATKIGPGRLDARLPVTKGQLLYELAHLRAKLDRRAPQELPVLARVKVPEPHPLFEVQPGAVEVWERLD